MGVVVDKLGFMRKLESDGDVTRAQAEKLTDAFYDAVVESVATKQDVGDVRTEISQLRLEMKSELAAVRLELKAGIAENKVWGVSIGATIIAVLAAIKFFA